MAQVRSEGTTKIMNMNINETSSFNDSSPGFTAILDGCRKSPTRKTKKPSTRKRVKDQNVMVGKGHDVISHILSSPNGKIPILQVNISPNNIEEFALTETESQIEHKQLSKWCVFFLY